MKTQREVAKEQVKIQAEMQSAGFNVVTCGNCGSTIIHRIDKEDKIYCFCGEQEKSNCPDYWYEGCEDSVEFNED